jgi:hypothetical protein
VGTAKFGDRSAAASCGGGGRTYFRYFATNMVGGGFEEFPYLDSLYGNSLTMTLPVKQLWMSEGESYRSYVADLSVKGRHFSGTTNEDGLVTIEFKQEK